MEIDWTPLDGHPESTCYCKCGRVYASHVKLVMQPKMQLVTRRPCPECGETVKNIRRASDGPFNETISRKDVGHAD